MQMDMAEHVPAVILTAGHGMMMNKEVNAEASDNKLQVKMYLSQQQQVPELSLQLSLGGPYFHRDSPKELQLLPLTSVAAASSGTAQLQLTLATPDFSRTKPKKRKNSSDSCSSSNVKNTRALTDQPPATTQAAPKMVVSNVPQNCHTSNGLHTSNTAQEALPVEVTPVRVSMNTDPARNLTVKVDPPAKRVKNDDCKMIEIGEDTIRSMPTVYTSGGGGNMRRIEGVLYKYNIWDGACIMCFCHGKFLTPMEFVKHAGCARVDDPMKYIKVVTDN